MTNNISPLTLAFIKLNTYRSDGLLSRNYPGEWLFDDRRSLSIDKAQSALAVLLGFFDGRESNSEPDSGIRRSVSVSLRDITDSYTISTTVIYVDIPEGKATDVYRVDFPFAYDNVRHSHAYNICVRDDASGRTLGKCVFRLFDVYYCGKHISDWFTVLSGGVAEPGKPAVYKALRAECPGRYAVRFRLKVGLLPIYTGGELPEMSVRICYPDDTDELLFGELECEDGDKGVYRIDIPFLMEDRKKGVVYLALLCLDGTVTHLVFNTDSDPIAGAWTGSELKRLTESSHEADLCFESIDAEDDESETGSADDDFERDLRNFTGSEEETPESELAGTDSSDVDRTGGGPDEADEDEMDEDETKETDTDETEMKKNDTGETEADEDGDWTSASAFFDRLTGLTSVKEKLSMYEKIVRFNRLRIDNNLSSYMPPLHAMFLGSPGTGKTTVARGMGAMLRRAGVLSKGHVVIRERASLLGPYYSSETKSTLDAIEEAQGGILFIDEAYQLYQPDDPRDPGKFVIEALITALSDESKRDWMLILAGYPDEMKRMFDMNTGLKSRIPDTNIYVFEDFTDSELLEIAQNYLCRYNYTLSPEAYDALARRIAADSLNRDKYFGNARYVINLIQTEIIPAMAARVLSGTDVGTEMLSEILSEDIPESGNTIRTARPRIGFRA